MSGPYLKACCIFNYVMTGVNLSKILLYCFLLCCVHACKCLWYPHVQKPVSGLSLWVWLSRMNVRFALLNCTSDHCCCPAGSPETSSSILSSSCSTSSSILSSPPASSLSSSDLLSPSLAAGVELSRPRCLWLRLTLRVRPFLLGPKAEG